MVVAVLGTSLPRTKHLPPASNPPREGLGAGSTRGSRKEEKPWSPERPNLVTRFLPSRTAGRPDENKTQSTRVKAHDFEKLDHYSHLQKYPGLCMLGFCGR